MRFGAPDKSLSHLLTRLVDGQITAEEAVTLEIALQHDPAARDHYRMFMAVHLGLQEVFQADPGVIPLPAPRRRVPVWSWLAVAAAVAMVAGGVSWGWRNRTGAREVAAVDTDLAQPVLAMVASTHNVLWDRAQPAAPGLRLTAGKVQLRQGEIVLTLVNGQTLAVRGPAELELINEREVELIAGAASFRNEAAHGLFVVRVPHGAAVTSGGEFSINAQPGADTQMRVFGGEISVSTVKANGRSCEEALVTTGVALEIGSRLQPSPLAATGFFQIPRPLPTAESSADAAYATAVTADQPLAYWRFEDTVGERQIPDQMGSHRLDLIGAAELAGPPGQRFLAVDDRQRSGFAYGREPITGWSGAGFSIECLFYSASESFGTVLALESATAGAAPARLRVHHAAQLCVIERMGRLGERIGHIHPDYAVRALQRFPAGFEGGTNLYSAESHLLHAWHHVTLTSDGSTMRLYLDGRLSDEAPTSFVPGIDDIRPVIGRLQPDPRDELRQWIGGIDEVAIYPRVLDTAAVMRHYAALRKR